MHVLAVIHAAGQEGQHISMSSECHPLHGAGLLCHWTHLRASSTLQNCGASRQKTKAFVNKRGTVSDSTTTGMGLPIPLLNPQAALAPLGTGQGKPNVTRTGARLYQTAWHHLKKNKVTVSDRVVPLRRIWPHIADGQSLAELPLTSLVH